METQRGLRKGQYSSPPPVCVYILRLCLSLSHLQPISTFRVIQRDLYFCQESVIMSVHNKISIENLLAERYFYSITIPLILLWLFLFPKIKTYLRGHQFWTVDYMSYQLKSVNLRISAFRNLIFWGTILKESH